MKSSRVIVGLLVLSFGLIAALAYLAKNRPAKSQLPAHVESLTTNRTHSFTTTAIPEEPMEPPPPGFSWSSIESADYKEYIAKLRGIECPEQTIRDIIIADVNKLYAPREAPFKAPQNYPLPWETRVSTSETLSVAESRKDHERHKQLREVENEKNALLKELLDFEQPLEALRAWHSRNYQRYETALNALPTEKREQVRAILENYWEASDQLYDKYNLRRTPEYLGEYQQINTDRLAQLGKVLTPGELEDYEMRSTGVASRLSAQLRDFKPSEVEFREIYRVRHEVEEPFGGTVRPDRTEAVNGQDYARQQSEANQKIREVLGEERYAEYERSQDSNYRRLANIGERYNVPPEKILEAYQLQKTSQSGVQQIASDPSLNKQQRRETVESMNAQNQEQLKALLGDRAYNLFSRRGQNRVTVGGE
ncbi:MAG: hypothetical protein ABI651_02740 [Verrucomicrobiota bacterium]